MTKELGEEGGGEVRVFVPTARQSRYPVARPLACFLGSGPATEPMEQQIRILTCRWARSIRMWHRRRRSLCDFDLLTRFAGSVPGYSGLHLACPYGMTLGFGGGHRLTAVEWFLDLVASCCSFSHCRTRLTRDCGEEGWTLAIVEPSCSTGLHLRKYNFPPRARSLRLL